MKQRALILGLVFSLAAWAGPVRAESDASARAARWEDLKHAVFGDRPVRDGAGVVTLEAPARAMDAALVPVTVTLGGDKKITALYLLVDNNPSPLAGTFHFGPASDPRVLKTRLRVDQYTLIHAVAATDTGELFATEQYVKAAGGCSAPSTKDAKLGLERLGQMRLRVDGVPKPGEPATAQLLISHPNYNGMQMDQVTRNYTPARYIQTISVRDGDRLVFAMDADISLSEDPAISFGFVPDGPASLSVEVHDSSDAVFQQSFPLPSGGA